MTSKFYIVGYCRGVPYYWGNGQWQGLIQNADFFLWWAQAHTQMKKINSRLQMEVK